MGLSQIGLGSDSCCCSLAVQLLLILFNNILLFGNGRIIRSEIEMINHLAEYWVHMKALGKDV